MLVVLLTSALISALLIIISIMKGWFIFPIIWIGSVMMLVGLGWLAVMLIKPRYPEWWEQNIAGVDKRFIEIK